METKEVGKTTGPAAAGKVMSAVVVVNADWPFVPFVPLFPDSPTAPGISTISGVGQAQLQFEASLICQYVLHFRQGKSMSHYSG